MTTRRPRSPDGQITISPTLMNTWQGLLAVGGAILAFVVFLVHLQGTLTEDVVAQHATQLEVREMHNEMNDDHAHQQVTDTQVSGLQDAVKDISARVRTLEGALANTHK